MPPIRYLLAAASVAALCVPALAQSAPDGAGPQHAWHKPTPQEAAEWHARMCNDHYARQAGRLAYLEAALSINDSQRGAFDQWRSVVLGAAKSRTAECLAHTPDEHGTHDALERNARIEHVLESRLAELHSERPALEALYQSLSPEQKKLFDEAGHHHGRHHMGGERFGAAHDGKGPHGPG